MLDAAAVCVRFNYFVSDCLGFGRLTDSGPHAVNRRNPIAGSAIIGILLHVDKVAAVGRGGSGARTGNGDAIDDATSGARRPAE